MMTTTTDQTQDDEIVRKGQQIENCSFEFFSVISDVTAKNEREQISNSDVFSVLGFLKDNCPLSFLSLCSLFPLVSSNMKKESS